MGTGSEAISGLTQMLNCGGNCNCCNELRQRITQLENVINGKAEKSDLFDFIRKPELEPAMGLLLAAMLPPNINPIKNTANQALNIANQLMGKIPDVDWITRDIENLKRQTAEAKGLAGQAKGVADQAKGVADSVADGFTDVRQRAGQAVNLANEAKNNSFTALGKAQEATNGVQRAIEKAQNALNTATSAMGKALDALSKAAGIAGLIVGILNTIGTLMVIFPRLDAIDRELGALSQQISNVYTTIGAIKAELRGYVDQVKNELYGQINNLNGLVNQFIGDVTRLGLDIGNLKNSVSGLGVEVGNIKNGLADVANQLNSKVDINTFNQAIGKLTNDLAGKANLSDLFDIRTIANSAMSKALESFSIANIANDLANFAINQLNQKANLSDLFDIRTIANNALDKAIESINNSSQANNKADKAINEINQIKPEINTAKTTATNAINEVNQIKPQVQRNTQEINQLKPEITTAKTTATNADKKADTVITGFVPMNYRINKNTSDIEQLKQGQQQSPDIRPVQQQNQQQQQQINQQQQQIQQLQRNKADRSDLECNNLLNRINECKQGNGDDDVKFNNITVKNVVCNDGEITESDLTLSVIQGTEIQIQKQFELLNHIVKHQCQMGEPYPVVPEWWQVRAGQRPQLVILYADVDAQGKLGKSRWSISIPHYNRDKNFKPKFPSYHRGNTEGIMTLKDNSKIIVNCKDATECKRILNVYKQFLPVEILQGHTVKIGERSGVDYKQVRVIPVRCTFFATGQKDMLPTWWLDLKKKKQGN